MIVCTINWISIRDNIYVYSMNVLHVYHVLVQIFQYVFKYIYIYVEHVEHSL